MGVERLIAEIERGAEEAIAEILGEARAEAERRSAPGSADAPALPALAARKEALAVELSRARLAARRCELEARAELLSRVRAAAEAALAGVHERAEVREVVPGLLAAALACARQGAITVRVHPAHEVVVRRLLADRDAAVVLDASVAPGVVVEDGRAALEATLRSSLDRAWPEIALALAREVEPR